MHSQQQKDYDSSPPPCAELDYLDIHSQPGDMRYTQEANTSALAIEPSQPPALLSIYRHPTGLATTTQYPQDSNAFYQPVSQLFPSIDVRSRLNPNFNSTATSTGMAQAHHQQHRTTGLPHLTGQVSAREQYSAATPSFRRASEHPVRSPSFTGVPLRRLPLSPTPSPLNSYVAPAGRMEAGQFQNRPSAAAVPPLMSVQTSGSLQYENGTQIKIDITGTVDKGFFLAEGEWTCYRRNYMTCACSYSLHPHYPNTAVHFIPPGSSQAYQVYGIYMSISAVVADNDQQSIELIQHTPKRDKGPTSKPEKVLLAPKNSVPSHHVGMYNDTLSASGARAVYQDGYGGGQGSVQPATEHTFERIQFKQATQNNGKRRAAQQYYHLMVELWADLGSQFGSQSADKYFKIAFRKSEKMIVRGRSPGHYQNEKRRSHSGGPGGSSGTMGGYGSLTGIGEFSPHSGILGGSSTYGTSYDSRGSVYGTPRSHDVPSEATMSSEDDKGIASTKGYLYYPGPMYDSSHSRHVEMFGTRNDQETSPSQSSVDTKVKSEYDMTPRAYHPPSAENRRHPGLFEAKSTSGGYYPTILSSPTTSLAL
ncbi:p53-like transcription factor [Trichoderma barbatum]